MLFTIDTLSEIQTFLATRLHKLKIFIPIVLPLLMLLKIFYIHESIGGMSLN